MAPPDRPGGATRGARRREFIRDDDESKIGRRARPEGPRASKLGAGPRAWRCWPWPWSAWSRRVASPTAAAPAAWGIGSKLTNGVQVASATKVFHHKGERRVQHLRRGGGGRGGDGRRSGIPVAPGGMVVPAPGDDRPGPGDRVGPDPARADPEHSAERRAPAGRPDRRDRAANPASTRTAPAATTGRATRPTLPRNGVAREAVDRRGPGAPLDARAGRPASARPPADSDDLLDHIPPVDLPGEVTRKAVSLPAPAAVPAADPAPTPAPAPGRRPRRRDSGNAAPTPAETVSAAEGAADLRRRRAGPGPGDPPVRLGRPLGRRRQRPRRSRGSTGSRRRATGRSSTSARCPRSTRISSTPSMIAAWFTFLFPSWPTVWTLPAWLDSTISSPSPRTAPSTSATPTAPAPAWSGTSTSGPSSGKTRSRPPARPRRSA